MGGYFTFDGSRFPLFIVTFRDHRRRLRTTLWRLKKGKALGINFDTLEKVCLGLNCQPGDVLKLTGEKKAGKRRTRSGGR